MADVIVDACVMHSAGETENIQAVDARSLLDSVMTSGASVILEDRLEREWSAHSSGYALRWRAALESRSRIVRTKLREASWVPFEISLGYLDFSNAACARKDGHLVLASLHFRAIVISSEVASRNVFTHVSKYFDALCEVRWSHPSDFRRIELVCSRRMASPQEWFLTYRFIP